MSVIKQQELHELLYQGARQADERGQAILVSQVRKVAPIDPLSFFSVGKKHFPGERTYWTEPTRETTLVGIGSAYKFSVDQEDEHRFDTIEKQWNALLENSIVGPSAISSGTGPVIVGGFSFDPFKANVSHWEGFSAASFLLPAFLLTVKEEGTWLTVNHVTTRDMDVKQTAENMLNLFDSLIEDCASYNPSQEEQTYSIMESDTEAWKKTVKEAARDIRNGKMEKIVLAREVEVDSKRKFNPGEILQRLNSQQPDSFLFAIERENKCFIGASPERLVKKEEDKFFSTCLAGSIKRGKTAEEDELLGEELLNDEKNLHEHQLVVKMIRDAMETGCDFIQVPEEPVLYKVRDIQHLYTPVVGKAKYGTTLISMVERLHPTPALGGYPKDRAISEIREREIMDRGWYAAPIGWIDSRGDGEFAVGIRSGLLDGKKAFLFAGCGIVGDSDPESEYQETRIKLRPMLSALGGKES
ncbi:isochorismate synthase [Pseudalkalibacillus caeni]|uniref:isochorismate synthase n=1 Tax=Exobacillus caeni TaxID=2574798 RepID=UPI001485391D|nr:isochorismate synthase [Pseudalkalibacillus caeni]